ncbi:MAG: hypothetical protein AAGI46_13555 [Planctomycetota bacterium]
MGWMRTLFLGDIGNRLDIADAERSIDDVRQVLRKGLRHDMGQDEQIRALKLENEELEMGMAALVKLLKDKGVLDEAEVRQLVDKIDPKSP